MPDPDNLLRIVQSCVVLLTAGLAAFGLGRALVRGLGCEESDLLSTIVWSLASGLIVAGVALMGLGLVGWLYRPVIGALTLAAGFWGLGEVMQEGRRRSDERASFHSSAPLSHGISPPLWLFRAAFFMVLAALVGSFVSALAPPTAGDALCYHLDLPKQFLARHAIVFFPDHDNSTFPLLAEMWYLWALALDGGVSAQLIHWALGPLLALATTLLARPIVGRAWAWTAGGAALLVPGISNEMSAPLNDVALAAYCTLALAAWMRLVAFESNGRWGLMFGVMLGAALAIKYLAILLCLAVACTTGLLAWRQADRAKQWLRPLASAVVVACAVAGPWYLRAAWLRGNPVYPFFQETLTGAGRDTLPASKAALGRTPWTLPLAPWEVTMHPERFGGRGHQLGAIFLATLPAIFVARSVRGLKLLLGVATLYAGGWFFLRQNVRFLFPLVPVMAIGAAWFWHECFRLPLWPRRITVACMLAMLGVGAVLPLARCRPRLAVALGIESRDDYLYRHEPTFPIARAANELLPVDANVLTQEHRAFYFDAALTRESGYRRRTAYQTQIARPADAASQLLARGFTHLLLAESGPGGIHYNATLREIVDASAKTADDVPVGHRFACLFDQEFVDSEGTRRRYRLIEIR